CATDRGGAVRLTIKPGALHVAASSQNIEFEDDIAIAYQGEAITISFNPQFIIDGLKSMAAEHIVLSLTTPNHPALIEASGDDSYQYIIMPMRS
ncbi:MAG: DNA polymerase III subunit beta, partial [Elusimicrobia bacterium]|nr:DNA polymerase III subunit beta [Elusimicrobiota bacterium]